MSNVLPLFWDLASSSKDTRISASANLIESLQAFQRSFLATKADGGLSSDDEDEEADGELEDEGKDQNMAEMEVAEDEDVGTRQDQEAMRLEKDLVARNAEDVVYSVRRLIRGLGSSRESSRLGFAVALTEVCLPLQQIRS